MRMFYVATLDVYLYLYLLIVSCIPNVPYVSVDSLDVIDVIFVNIKNPNPKLFTHCEYSFTIEPVPGDKIYIRYQLFKSPQGPPNGCH